MYRIWKDRTPWKGLALSEPDYTTLTLELAVRLPETLPTEYVNLLEIPGENL